MINCLVIGNPIVRMFGDKTISIWRTVMLMRGRVKLFFADKGYGWIEGSNGVPDHFIHRKQRKRLLLGLEGLTFGQSIEDDREPKEGDWVIFESGQLPGKSQPQAMPWSYADELSADFRRLGSLVCDCLRLLGLTF